MRIAAAGTTGIALAPPPGPDAIVPTNTGVTLTATDIDRRKCRRARHASTDATRVVYRGTPQIAIASKFRDGRSHRAARF